jgi:spore germination protein KA
VGRKLPGDIVARIWSALKFGRRRRGKPAGLDRPADLQESDPSFGPLPAGPRLWADLDRNRDYIVEAYGGSPDLITREILLGWEGADRGRRALLVHFDGLVDKKVVADNIIHPLTGQTAGPHGDLSSPAKAFETIKTRYVTVSDIQETDEFPTLLFKVSSGDCAVFVDGLDRALICSARGWPERAVEEPPSESAVRGPRDGFTENLLSNLTFIRRRIKDPRLRVAVMRIGRITQTNVALVHVAGVARPELVAEAQQRLQRIDVDGIVESGYIEELIEDDPFSPFPQLHRTERPDRVVGSLLEGRIAILIDGAPMVLVAPAGFAQFLTAAEDYYERFLIGSFLGLIRALSFFAALLLPSLYIAVTTFHQELLPTSLILNIAAQREGIPFPAFVEALILELSFDVLREASVRLPRLIGPTISIVGVLVVGQAAVQAGLVSPFMVIVVAFTGIASFAAPGFGTGLAVRVIRYAVMALAASLGLFGILTGASVLYIHLLSLRSFGLPFLAPLAPLITSDLKDTVIRMPWWMMNHRPSIALRANRRRQAPGQKPQPPPGGKAKP